MLVVNCACCEKPGLPPTCKGFRCSSQCQGALNTVLQTCSEVLTSKVYLGTMADLTQANKMCSGKNHCKQPPPDSPQLPLPLLVARTSG